VTKLCVVVQMYHYFMKMSHLYFGWTIWQNTCIGLVSYPSEVGCGFALQRAG